jgi:hypothetical protein
MSQMTTQQARGGDPYLTEVAQNAILQEFVGHHLFPSVSVTARGGNVLEVEGHEQVLYETERVPGSNVAKVYYGFQDKPFHMASHGLAETVPAELVDQHSQYPGEALQKAAALRVMRKLGLRVEYEQAQKALNPASYSAANKRTLSGAAQWTDEDSTPTADIETGRKAIRAKKGFYPNVALLSAAAFAAVRLHPAFAGRDPITPEYLAALWDIEKVVVGKATYQAADETFIDVWGQNLILAYVPPNEPVDLLEPSFGYTYRYEGCPHVDAATLEKKTNNWVHIATDEFFIELVMADAGYLLQNVVPSA